MYIGKTWSYLLLGSLVFHIIMVGDPSNRYLMLIGRPYDY